MFLPLFLFICGFLYLYFYVCFRELTHMIMEAGKSRISRLAAQESRCCSSV